MIKTICSKIRLAIQIFDTSCSTAEVRMQEGSLIRLTLMKYLILLQWLYKMSDHRLERVPFLEETVVAVI